MSLTFNGTSGLTFPDGTTQNTQALPGMRNRIINGDMRIDQRYAGAAVNNPGAAALYCVDRWFINGLQSNKISAQKNAGSVTPPEGFKNYLGITSLSAYSVPSAETYVVAQKIEGLNLTDLNWGTASARPITISFWVRSSITGTHSGSIRNGDTTRSYLFSFNINSANTWEYETITIPGDTAGSWLTTNDVGANLSFNLGAGSTYSGTAGSWLTGNYGAVTGTVSVVGTSGATFYITGVQLEKGSTATPFEVRSYGAELALCQRYYQFASFGIRTAAVSGNTYGGTLQFPPMRALPTYTFISPHTATNFQGSPNLIDIWLNSALDWTCVASGTNYGTASYYGSLSSEL